MARAGKANRALIKALKVELKKAADPAKSEPMRAYMKSTMPYHGVNMPLRRKVGKALFKEHTIETAPEWRATILELWDTAKFREERYAAIDLAEVKSYDAFRTQAALPMYKHMIKTGAWWDYVDPVASHGLGFLLRNNPKSMPKTMRTWARAKDMWVRRSSILCQLSLKEETDLKLMHDCMEPSFGTDEFFLQKAMGWALRQYAWKNPKAVIAYVKKHRSELSKLTKREALKNVIKDGSIKEIP